MRRKLFSAVWDRRGGVRVAAETPAWATTPGTVRARYDDGKLTSVTGFHRSPDRAEMLVMREVRNLLMGPAQA